MAQTGVLSGSTNGLGILVNATATLGDTIHTAVTGTTQLDQVSLKASNIHTSAVELTLEWGEDTATKIIKQTIPADSGDVILTIRKPLRNALLVTAFAAEADVITINGDVLQAAAAEVFN